MSTDRKRKIVPRPARWKLPVVGVLVDTNRRTHDLQRKRKFWSKCVSSRHGRDDDDDDATKRVGKSQKAKTSTGR